MARPKILMYVDVVSPFSYEAYYLLRHDPVFKDCEVTYVPIFLGGLMNKCGNTAPIRIKNKDKWISQERTRWAKTFNIPISPTLPADFPANTLPIGRALASLPPTDLTKTLDILFRKYWVENVPLHRPDVLRDALTDIFGGERAASILADAATTGKQTLIQNTDKAFEDGAFGLPWMVCTNTDGQTEGFWGVDHIGQVVQFLGLDRTKGLAKTGWRAVL
ncbi:glutathione S-transferase kappa 1 [Echria macrotheca]|uniref:Glutathione S-transferase kappa n=1 Tax=Echria macrotheca TaxID=438768 RepID=A0AAJ0BMR2_9PEZI|nr:glutathione S-transferase kappa 1 [Echria macrotheca]